eukprot:Skav209347  [mRNA]  locus=scaffold241:645286:645684:- [translate_table: standard]
MSPKGFVAAALVAMAITLLQGCGYGQVYESEAEALDAICGGSSCKSQCTCCVQMSWAQGQNCSSGVTAGSEPWDVYGCGGCISSYADENWKPEYCFSDRNMGHCGYQYWNNEKGECDAFDGSCELWECKCRS